MSFTRVHTPWGHGAWPPNQQPRVTIYKIGHRENEPQVEENKKRQYTTVKKLYICMCFVVSMACVCLTSVASSYSLVYLMTLTNMQCACATLDRRRLHSIDNAITEH